MEGWTKKNKAIGNHLNRFVRSASGAPNGIRTRVLALKGPRPSPLDDRDTCADDYMQIARGVKKYAVRNFAFVIF